MIFLALLFWAAVVSPRAANGWGLEDLPKWFISHSATNWIFKKEPDTLDRVKQNGYPCEKHDVTTEDGYVLTMFRIPHGKQPSNGSAEAPHRPSIIVQHGLLCSSDCWVVGNASRALAFVLADRGYDVWLANNRGNTYSRSHVNLTVRDDAFWDFSIHEMGVYDLPAQIDYILTKTGRNKTSYIGHSQGTSIAFIMASSRPDHTAKLSLVAAMAPVVYLDATKGVIQALSRMSKFIESMAKLLGVRQVLERNFFSKIYNNAICGTPLVQKACADTMFIVGGINSQGLDYNILREMGNFAPSGTSAKDIIHFGQWTRNGGKFAKFDYEKNNLKRYNTTKPPEYPLRNIVCPVALFFSCNDFIATCPQTERLASQIPTLVGAYKTSDKYFNHMDFMWGTNIDEALYKHMLPVLKKYVE